MIAELNIFGVFINAGLIAVLVAGVLVFALRRLLVAANAYRLVWHAALFDLALFVLLWGLVVFVQPGVESRLVLVFG